MAEKFQFQFIANRKFLGVSSNVGKDLLIISGEDSFLIYIQTFPNHISIEYMSYVYEH